MSHYITPEDISDVRIQYDRNGSGGEGSYLVFFRVHSEEYDNEPFVGVMWQSTTSNYYRGEEDRDTVHEMMIHRVADIMQIGAAYMNNSVPDRLDIPAFRSTDYFLSPLRAHLAKAYRGYFTFPMRTTPFDKYLTKETK